MFHPTDFGGFLVCCYKAIQQLNGAEKNSVAISLMLNHYLTGLVRKTALTNYSEPHLRATSIIRSPSCPLSEKMIFDKIDKRPPLPFTQN